MMCEEMRIAMEGTSEVVKAFPTNGLKESICGKKHVAIAVTGSLYKYHPTLKTLLDKYIGKMVPNRSFHTFLTGIQVHFYGN